MIARFFLLLFLTTFSALAQSNLVATASNSPPQIVLAQTNQSAAIESPSIDERAAQIRAACIQGRRSICGKILKVLPDGLVVESGYTNLMRSPLDREWLIPGTAVASRATGLVEGNTPGSVCVGLVFITDIPKSRRVKPKPYDYVIIQGYPAGQYTYTSLGTIQRTIRRFAAGLPTAVNLCLAAEEQTPTSPDAK
jgi:hypothetical protein